MSRLLEPWSTPHQICDDLESFFWVLLYQIIRGRDEKKQFRKAMVKVFDQFESVRGNRSKGGDGKLSVFDSKGGALPTRVILGLTFGTPCSDIVDELRALFTDFYRFVDYDKGPNPKVEAMYEERREKDLLVQEARKKLQSSDTFLAILDKYLNSPWDVNDDGSLEPSDPLPDPSASRNRRKRPAPDSDDEKLNFNDRRRGVMPPRSNDSGNPRNNLRPRNSLSTQASSSANAVFSLPSRMQVSTDSPASDSPRPSDEGSSSKS